MSKILELFAMSGFEEVDITPYFTFKGYNRNHQNHSNQNHSHYNQQR
jgi:hypothetical protein